MARRFMKIAPPVLWLIPVIIMVGIIMGIAAFSFHISRAPSYLSDKPETCTNCHIMSPQYATWSHSSHREHAHCNDCHVPHNNLVNKYYFKAKDGMRHATVFTLRNEPQVIFIKKEGKEVVMENCIRCHAKLLTDSKMLTRSREIHDARMERKCWECHREVPHGRVNSLTSTPAARVPVPSSPVPNWLKELTDK